MLIKNGAAVDKENGWLRTPLHYAAEHGRRNVCSLLLRSGADVNLLDWHKYSPLHFACLRGHRATVKVLLESGADPSLKTISQQTPLHLAANARVEVALLLLQYGASVDAKAKGSTPLHEAAKAGNTGMVECLLSAGAAAESVNANRKTAMQIVAQNRDSLTEQILLKYGAFAPHLRPVITRPKEPEDAGDSSAALAELLTDKPPELGSSKKPSAFKKIGLKVIKAS